MARAALARAETDHQREQDEIAFRAFVDRLQAIDAMLVQCLHVACEAGAKIGRYQVSQVYRPSETLDRALRLGIRP